MEIHIRGLNNWKDGIYPLLLLAEKDELLWEQVKVKGGIICEQKYLSFQKVFESKEGIKIPIDQICGLAVRRDERYLVASKWEKAAIPEDKRRDIIHAACEEEIEEKKFGNKWENLCKCYRNVHPFGDNHIFISIEPKDLVILENSYRKLANNSFLLHGFYNYRHIIVGPNRSQPLEGKTSFCLGVPGTYYEREKMVAIMFGFEGFECEGPVEIGKNGYYMRDVNLF